jgi:hypothetical protein
VAVYVVARYCEKERGARTDLSSSSTTFLISEIGTAQLVRLPGVELTQRFAANFLLFTAKNTGKGVRYDVVYKVTSGVLCSLLTP